jgi:flavodoxin
MKGIIIYNTKSGNTELLGNKMKEILEKSGHEIDIKRDKEIKDQIVNESSFLNPYDLLCLGSCTHFIGPAFSFRKILKKINKLDVEGKKLICFATSGHGKGKPTNKKIKKIMSKLEHVGTIGCDKLENENALKAFEEIVKNM